MSAAGRRELEGETIAYDRKHVGRWLKRAMDIAGAWGGLVVLSPLLAATSIAIGATMGRPVLFTQMRPGCGGQPFRLYKFRTMVPAQAKEVWFRTDDQRLTELGRFLRQWSIDELPTLWNVLRGDMSLVGPRPLLTEYLSKYTPTEMRRHEMSPGITGWAQVNGRQHIAFSDRLARDVWYVDHWSVGLDLKILFKTLGVVAMGHGVVSGQNVDHVDDLGLSSDRQRRDPPRSNP